MRLKLTERGSVDLIIFILGYIGSPAGKGPYGLYCQFIIVKPWSQKMYGRYIFGQSTFTVAKK